MSTFCEAHEAFNQATFEYLLGYHLHSVSDMSIELCHLSFYSGYIFGQWRQEPQQQQSGV